MLILHIEMQLVCLGGSYGTGNVALGAQVIIRHSFCRFLQVKIHVANGRVAKHSAKLFVGYRVVVQLVCRLKSLREVQASGADVFAGKKVCWQVQDYCCTASNRVRGSSAANVGKVGEVLLERTCINAKDSGGS